MLAVMYRAKCFMACNLCGMVVLQTLELLAEVAVLEEEVARLEEQVVNCRQGLYQEAISTCSTRNVNHSPPSGELPSINGPRKRHSRSFSQSEVNERLSVAQRLPSLPRSSSTRRLVFADPGFDGLRDRPANGNQGVEKSNVFLEDGLGKENHSCANSTKDKRSPEKKKFAIQSPVKRTSVRPKSICKDTDPRNLQVRTRIENFFEVFQSQCNVVFMLAAIVI